MSNQKTVHVAEDVKVRLSALANKSGHTVDQLADTVLRAHVDAQERAIIEKAEDERRWQRYLETGQTVSLESMRGKLHTLASEAAILSEPQ